MFKTPSNKEELKATLIVIGRLIAQGRFDVISDISLYFIYCNEFQKIIYWTTLSFAEGDISNFHSVIIALSYLNEVRDDSLKDINEFLLRDMHSKLEESGANDYQGGNFDS